ncbi:MAG: hypothetical protein ABW104_07660 [Candidatus Thiodiazotropha sp. 6PLUC2]
MIKVLKYLLGGLLLIASVSTALAKVIDSIDSYGIYVVTSNGYVKVESYSHDYDFVDFNYANEIPFAARGDDALKLVVYAKKFDPNSVELELRHLDVVVKREKIGFSVKPLDKTDMYELHADAPISDGAMLHVRSWLHFDRMGVVMLGDTEAELVKFFSQKEMENATAVTQYLDDARVAFPDNDELKVLSKYWKSAAKAEKDIQAYTYVEEKWQQYENAEKLSLKARYLNAVMGEINGYLNQYPDGVKAEEAEQRRLIAEEKLEEYEKLL